MRAVFDECVLGLGRVDKMLDLGCGTSLVGLEFRDTTDFIVGVDLSVKMIASAQEKGVYDELYAGDLTEFLNRSDVRYGLFVAADVCIYVGDMRSVLSSIQKSANSCALVLFTTEDSEGDAFYLQSSGRVTNSYNYMRQLAGELGFDIKYFERDRLRESRDGWIVGGLYGLVCPQKPLIKS